MVEPASDTSDQQRFDEMFLHLTPRGAVVPYGICYDPEGNIWVATKGGLFKFHGDKLTTLWERKNLFPKKMAAFSQIVCYNNTIIYTCGEDKEKTTELRFFSLNGEQQHESFFDGLIFSLVVSSSGDMYASKHPIGAKSTIIKASIDAPIGWDDVISIQGEAFQSLCVLDNNTLVASVAERPVQIYSKQRMVLIDIESGKIKKSFSSGGKEGEHVFFPRSIVRYNDGFVVMDKSGRFLNFSADGEFLGLLAEIDAYLANGFCIKNDAALIALSGVVLDQDRRTICDDWLEWINLDGSSWKKQRTAKLQT